MLEIMKALHRDHKSNEKLLENIGKLKTRKMSFKNATKRLERN